MAVLALPALSAAITPGLVPWGVQLGLVLTGGLIDQRILFPALLGKPSVRAPRIGDNQLTEAFDGQPQNKLVCGTPRVPCAVIYKSKLRQVQSTSGGSGKGGPGSQVPIFKQYVDLGLQVGRRIGPDTVVEEILLVFADGKKVFEFVPPVVPVAATDIVATIENTVSYGGQKIRRLILTSPDGSTDLSELASGKTADVSGFVGSSVPFSDATQTGTSLKGTSNLKITTPTGGTLNKDDTLVVDGHPTIYVVTANTSVSANIEKNIPVEPPITATISPHGQMITVRRGASSNNGTWLVITSSIDESTGISTAKFEHPDWDTDDPNYVYPFVAKAAGDPILIVQAQQTTSAGQLSRISFKLGARDQLPDRVLVAALQAEVGSAQVYGGHGRVEIWLEDFELTQYGNHVPFFECVVRVSSDDSLPNAVSLMMLDSGYGAASFDVTGLSGTCRGYSSRGSQPLNESLQPLQSAFQFITSEDGAQVVFTDRDALEVVDADYSINEIGLSAPGSRSPRPWNRTKRDDASMPYRVDVSYVDPDREYARGTQPSQFARPDGKAVVTSDLSPLVLTADEAKQVASRMLDVAWSSRVEMADGTAGPDFYDRLRAGVLLSVSDVWNQDWLLLVTRCEIGADGLLKFDGRVEDPESLVQTATAGEPV